MRTLQQRVKDMQKSQNPSEELHKRCWRLKLISSTDTHSTLELLELALTELECIQNTLDGNG